MWIIYCVQYSFNEQREPMSHHFIVGPFGSDTDAELAADELKSKGIAEVQPLVEPGRAMAGATF